jgi:hypothetical protein
VSAFPFLHVNVPGAASPALPPRLPFCAVILYPLAPAYIASLMCTKSWSSGYLHAASKRARSSFAHRASSSAILLHGHPPSACACVHSIDR